jgi:hypothetical protein
MRSHINLLSGLALLVTLFTSAIAQNAPPAVQEQLIAADLGIWQAIGGSRPNIEQVAKALAPQYLDIELGVRHSKEQVLNDLQAVRAFSFKYENPRAFILSATSGYVIAELSYSSVSNGSSSSGRVLTTTVFSKDQGRWIAHLHTEMDMKPAVNTSAPVGR